MLPYPRPDYVYPDKWETSMGTETGNPYEPMVTHKAEIAGEPGVADLHELSFWHHRDAVYDCAVCMSDWEGWLEHWGEQVTKSYGIPALTLGNSSLSGPPFSRGDSRYRSCEHSGCDPAYPCLYASAPGVQYVPEYAFKDFSMSRRERAAIDRKRESLYAEREAAATVMNEYLVYDERFEGRKTPQQEYDKRYDEFAAVHPGTPPETDLSLLAEMLSYVSGEVTGPTRGALCDEVQEPEKLKPWEVKLGSKDVAAVLLVFAVILGLTLLFM